MPTPIKPLGDRVVAVKEEAQEKTASGIYLPDSAKEHPVTAKVVAIGPDTSQVKVGARILYKEYAATTIELDGVSYLVVKEEDIIATVEK